MSILYIIQCVYIIINQQFSGVPLCPVLPNIQNGTVRYRIGKKEPAVGDIAIYSCNEEHRLKGEATRECGEDGKWLGVEPKCEPECEFYLASQFTSIEDGQLTAMAMQPLHCTIRLSHILTISI